MGQTRRKSSCGASWSASDACRLGQFAPELRLRQCQKSLPESASDCALANMGRAARTAIINTALLISRGRLRRWSFGHRASSVLDQACSSRRCPLLRSGHRAPSPDSAWSDAAFMTFILRPHSRRNAPNRQIRPLACCLITMSRQSCSLPDGRALWTHGWIISICGWDGIVIELLNVGMLTSSRSRNCPTKSRATSHTTSSESRLLSNTAHVPTVIPGCLYAAKLTISAIGVFLPGYVLALRHRQLCYSASDSRSVGENACQ